MRIKLVVIFAVVIISSGCISSGPEKLDASRKNFSAEFTVYDSNKTFDLEADYEIEVSSPGENSLLSEDILTGYNAEKICNRFQKRLFDGSNLGVIEQNSDVSELLEGSYQPQKVRIEFYSKDSSEQIGECGIESEGISLEMNM